MIDYHYTNNGIALRNLYRRTMDHGHMVSPRGLNIMEQLDAQITVHPSYPFNPFKARKYNVDYFVQEMRWKLGASRLDDTIKQHAKMWESVQNPDGSFNSNYGQYWFGDQMGLMKAVMELIRDQDSRRAVIPMLRDGHLSPETKDTVCTEAITFHIRGDLLMASVHMRSSDQIFGLGTDIPTFAVLMHLAHGLLKPSYPYLRVGTMTITAASSHIYEQHFQMANEITNLGVEASPPAPMLPECECAAEAMAIIAHRGVPGRKVHPAWTLYRFIYGDA